MLRLSIAAAVLAALVGDNPARLTRVQFESLPTMDYLGEVRSLRAQDRFAEALMVAESGLGELSGEEHAALSKEQAEVRSEQESLLRKGKLLLRGALVGEGDSLEALMGAVAADMLVVGDVRDLVIQGGKLAVDGDSDELILALSAAGLLTTVMPEVDWIAAFLKVAKKAGALSRHMVEALVRVIRRATDTRDYGELRRLFGHFQVLVEKSTPAGALRLLRHIDDPGEVAAVAGFLGRQPSGGFVLHVAGREGVDIIKSSSKEAEAVLVMAAKKGNPGVAWLRSGGARLLKPHLLLGLVKGLYKGTLPGALARLAEKYDPYGWLVIPACALWVFLEVSLLWRRLTRRSPAPAPTVPMAAAA
jgi:hypothetical protein